MSAQFVLARFCMCSKSVVSADHCEHLCPGTCALAGPRAQKKKALIAEGLLDKHGRPNERTPADWAAAESKPRAGSAVAKSEASAPAAGAEQASAGATDEAQSQPEQQKEHKKKKHASPPTDT